ncbi:MAG: YitT family protein [Bacilli bacterium]|nr:YitT family protein [Bacilli bacterium]
MVKKKSQRLRKQVDNFLFDHYIFKTVLDYFFCFIVAAISAVIFAFGFACFTTPAESNGFVLATGGVSGVAQIISLIVELITGSAAARSIIQSVGYTVLNIPLLIFSFFKISKKFTVFTFINVILSSVFIQVFAQTGVANTVATCTFPDGSMPLNTIIVRVLLAGVCTGLASSLAYTIGISCGGIDIVSFYLGARKSTQVGRYGIIINAVIVLTYALLRCVDSEFTLVYALYSAIFSVIYLMEVGIIIDIINLRNKKVSLQIITNKEHMPEIIIANFPHSATVVDGKGAYSGTSKTVFWMVVSSSEVKKVVNIAKKIDEHVFITATPLKQVYGNFFIKPLE